MKTKLEIIEETANYYNSNNRSTTPQGGCCYLSDDGNMCAVGRCLENPEEIQEGSFAGSFAEKLLDRLGDDILKEEYQGHDKLFWNELQRLHDKEYYWDEHGLTGEGRKYYEALKQKYGNSSNP